MRQLANLPNPAKPDQSIPKMLCRYSLLVFDLELLQGVFSAYKMVISRKGNHKRLRKRCINREVSIHTLYTIEEDLHTRFHSTTAFRTHSSIPSLCPNKLLHHTGDLPVACIVSAATPGHLNMVCIDRLHRLLFSRKVEFGGEVIDDLCYVS